MNGSKKYFLKMRDTEFLVGPLMYNPAILKGSITKTFEHLKPIL